MSLTGGLRSSSSFKSGSAASFSGSFVPSLHDITASGPIAHSSVDPCAPRPNGIPVRRRNRLKKHKKQPRRPLDRCCEYTKFLNKFQKSLNEWAQLLKRMPLPHEEGNGPSSQLNPVCFSLSSSSKLPPL